MQDNEPRPLSGNIAKDIESGEEYESPMPTPAPEKSLDDGSSNMEELSRQLTYQPTGLGREIIFVSVLCFSQLLTQAGLGQTIAPLHYIGATFGTQQPGQLSWFAASYSLTVGTFILIAGRLGDIFGHKKCLIAGFVWYGIWSLGAGFSAYSTQVVFDVCRAMQGIGPAFTLPNAIAILGRAYPPGRRQEMIFAIFGATAPCGFVLGAVFSSIFAEFVWWPWAFWVMAMVCGAVAVAAYLFIPKPKNPVSLKDGKASLFARIDVAGCLTGVTGLVLFNFAWNQGPVVGWTTPYTYIILIIGVLVFAVFAVIEVKSPFPLVPMGQLSSDTLFVLACIAAGWGSFGVWMYYLFQLEETLRNISPLLASAHFIPVALSGICAAVTTGKVLSKVPPSVVMLIAMVAFTVGGILIATAPVNQIYWAQTFVAIIIMPWGMDMSFPAATIILSRQMPRENQGLGASLVNTFVNYSISIGLGMAGTVERQVNDGGREVLKGYRGAWYLGIGLSGLGVVCASVMTLIHWRRRPRPSQRQQQQQD